MASMWDRSGYFYSLLPMITRNGVPVQVRGAAGHFSRLCSAALLVVSSTSHIKMFWQDHEKFPEVWRGHAAHEPPLTSRVKCQRQQLAASSGAVQAADKMSYEPRHIWSHTATAATTGWSKRKMFIFHCLYFCFTVPYRSLKLFKLVYCKRNNIYW